MYIINKETAYMNICIRRIEKNQTFEILITQAAKYH